MKKILLSTLLLIGLSPVPIMEAGFGQKVIKFLTNVREGSTIIAQVAADKIQPLIDDPVVYIGGTGLIVSAGAGIGSMLGSGLYLQKDIISAIVNNQITRGNLGKSALGLGLFGAGICSIIAAKHLYDKHD